MCTSTEASVTWVQALAWRMEQQLLDPVGTESVPGVVRRLGAVLAMDESLAELAVRVRRTKSRPGQLARALAEGKVIKAFAFRGSMHYLSPEDGGKDLFVHHSNIAGDGFKSLTEGAKVEYESREGQKGPEAINVVPQ